MQNSDVLANLGEKLQHLPLLEQKQLTGLILELVDLFPDTPQRTTLVHHDVDVGDAHPIKQHSYRLNPVKLEAMKKEVEYMLTQDIIEPSHSEWSSPVYLCWKVMEAIDFALTFVRLMWLQNQTLTPSHK